MSPIPTPLTCATSTYPSKVKGQTADPPKSAGVGCVAQDEEDDVAWWLEKIRGCVGGDEGFIHVFRRSWEKLGFVIDAEALEYLYTNLSAQLAEERPIDNWPGLAFSIAGEYLDHPCERCGSLGALNSGYGFQCARCSRETFPQRYRQRYGWDGDEIGRVGVL